MLFVLETRNLKFIVAVLNEMKEPRKYICWVGKQQLDIPLTITTLDTRETFQIKALLDSGCTGWCIDEEFSGLIEGGPFTIGSVTGTDVRSGQWSGSPLAATSKEKDPGLLLLGKKMRSISEEERDGFP